MVLLSHECPLGSFTGSRMSVLRIGSVNSSGTSPRSASSASSSEEEPEEQAAAEHARALEQATAAKPVGDQNSKGEQGEVAKLKAELEAKSEQLRQLQAAANANGNSSASITARASRTALTHGLWMIRPNTPARRYCSPNTGRPSGYRTSRAMPLTNVIPFALPETVRKKSRCNGASGNTPIFNNSGK